MGVSHPHCVRALYVNVLVVELREACLAHFVFGLWGLLSFQRCGSPCGCRGKQRLQYGRSNMHHGASNVRLRRCCGCGDTTRCAPPATVQVPQLSTSRQIDVHDSFTLNPSVSAFHSLDVLPRVDFLGPPPHPPSLFLLRLV